MKLSIFNNITRWFSLLGILGMLTACGGSSAPSPTSNPVQTPVQVPGTVGYSYVSRVNEDGYYPLTHCVKANATGLIWEGKTADGGLRDKNKTYTNYDDITKVQTYIGSGYPTLAMVNAVTNTVGYINAVNAQNLCGFNDWRLPTKDELVGLVVTTGGNPTIDTVAFPNTLSDYYWSSSPYSLNSYYAWFIVFNNGSGSTHFGYGNRAPYAVRLVR